MRAVYQALLAPMLVGCWLVLAIRCYDRLRSLDLDFLAVFRRRVIQATSGSTSRARRPSGRSYSGTPPCPSAPQTMKPSGRQMWVTASKCVHSLFFISPFPSFFLGGAAPRAGPFQPSAFSLSLSKRQRQLVTDGICGGKDVWGGKEIENAQRQPRALRKITSFCLTLLSSRACSPLCVSFTLC